MFLVWIHSQGSVGGRARHLVACATTLFATTSLMAIEKPLVIVAATNRVHRSSIPRARAPGETAVFGARSSHS